LAYRTTMSRAFRVYWDTFAWYCTKRFTLLSPHSDGPFEYGCLNKSLSEIRLLRLLPAQRGKQVAGELFTCSISDAPAFEAVSYRWKMGRQIPMLLDGCSFPVSQTVYFMLEGLRDQATYRVLWIDSICINQLDTSEKEWQILLMGDIFSSASGVVCWLHYDPLSSGGLTFLGHLDGWGDRVDDDGAVPQGLIDPNTRAFMQQPRRLDWAAALSLVSNEWFSRIWVMQEVAKGCDVLIRHGGEQLTWGEFQGPW
jgi:hypothetical protein